ncbi:DNA polymerase-3 subunit delta' [Sedimentibacter acidaminivorans]|uniref:DNA polymerase III subunit delta' n=1 Tax=Sedimentibacter acidaminivorans TaxID=913099 RepID=A0ABS4GB36_9FIRM|nr:DNA polymerase III subunit delta' C-terminal domain-containing protein [Sedimentibacter acidaminivorans]MBP1924899.1 DNA polymerase-3 subunit delta' [Sedimentibacter acidaminivorans]
MYYSDIAGQNDTKKSLINTINNDNVSHCYIFEGPKGMGKYELSLVFAQSLFCNNFKINEEPCNICGDCIKFNSMNHPDLHVINLDEKTIKREDIDKLIESINKKPYEASKKVYIIKDSHEMTPQAANTFLKTLEEPPKDSIIILLTNNINLLIPTIISRCQVIKFKDINKNEIKNFLIEKYNVDIVMAAVIAYYSKGILNKAINIITKKDDIIEKRKVVIELFDNIIKTDSGIIFDFEKYFEEQKDNIDEIIEILMLWIRDVTFVKNKMEGLLINKDYLELAKEHAKYMRNDSSDDLIENLQRISDNIKNNVNYKLTIDRMLLKIQEVFKYDKGSWRKI